MLTVGYLSLFLGVVTARFTELFSLPLNELGDFAAGAFGPLAFLWLVLGYRQQGKELNASTKALDQQVSELRASFALQQSIADKQDKVLDPVLQCIWKGPATVGEQVLQLLSITNSGNSCRQVHIDFESIDGSNATKGGSVLGLLPTDGSATINGPIFTGESFSWRVKVAYSRINGTRGEQNFIVVSFDGVSPPFVTPELEPIIN